VVRYLSADRFSSHRLTRFLWCTPYLKETHATRKVVVLPTVDFWLALFVAGANGRSSNGTGQRNPSLRISHT
jgi:hypothetical protein